MFYQVENSCRKDYFLYMIFRREGMMAHFHACFELLYAMRGDSHFTIGQESFCLREGEMALLWPNEIHAFHADDALWICVFSTDMVDSFERETAGLAYPRPIFKPSEALVGMMPKTDGGRFEDPFALRSFLYLACHEFFRQADGIPAARSADASAAHRILSYISQHYHQEITLAHLAKTFGMSRNYISALVGGMTRQNLRAYLNGYRIERAKQLLADSDKSITDAAYECGFGSIRTFNRAFAAQEGITPSEYRAQRGASRHTPGMDASGTL